MKKENKFKLIIFDFDGTIADSFELCFESINKILKDRGQEGITEREKEEARNLPAREVFEYFKIPNYQLPFVARKIINEMARNFAKVEPFSGIKTVLRTLEKKEISMVMLTSNIKKNTEYFLEKENIKDLFEDIYYKSGLFSKHIVINKLAKKYKIKKGEILLIGDEARDVEAAKKSRIKMAAVSWGFNSGKALLESEPDYFLQKTSEILDIIK